MFSGQTQEYLKTIEENQPPYSIEHSKKILEHYLQELEKFNTPEHQDFYKKQKLLIELESNNYRFKDIDFNPIIPLIVKKSQYNLLLKDNTESFFNELNLKSEFQEDLNKKEFESLPKYPTLINKDIFLLYKKENSDNFFKSLKNQNEVNGWKNLIEKYKSLNKPEPYLFLNLNHDDFDYPLIFGVENKVKFIFKFPLFNEDEEYKFKMIFKTIYDLTINQKFKIDDTKILIYYWEIDEDIQNALFYLIFNSK